MIHTSRSRPGGHSNNSDDFRRIFLRRVHQLIQLGYEQLDPTRYASEQEPAITGDLVKAIDTVLDDRSHAWMMHYSVHDDPPVNDPNRKGKQRLRVDIRIDCSTSSPRTRYRIEAKRLGEGNPIGKYLGVDGLGCFLNGAYGRDDNHGGMIGYVQSLDCNAWRQLISSKLKDARYHLKEKSMADVDSFGHPNIVAFKAIHSRPTVKRHIEIDHIVMRFY